MTGAQAFVEAVTALEARATGREKHQLMYAKGAKKAELTRRLFGRYAIPFSSDWFSDPAPVRWRPRKAVLPPSN